MTQMIVHMPVRAVTASALESPAPQPRPRTVRAPLAALLGITLANTLDLKGRVMHAKWCARQFDSSGLALALDEFGDDLELMADLLGQRMIALGYHPKALPADVTRISRLPPFKDSILKDTELVDSIAQSINATKHYLEPTISAAVAAGDSATSDVLRRLKRRLDRW